MVESGALGVVGAGVMGSEIAFLGAAAGDHVTLVDTDPGALATGLEHARAIAQRRLAKERLTREEALAIDGRLGGATDVAALADCDAVIEAVSERMEVKLAVFGALGDRLRDDALVASNTSGLSITDLGEAAGRPGSVVGMHFFNPASVMPLVEVIRGAATEEAAVDRAVGLAERYGKIPVRVRECPGFLVNRVLVRAVVEAYRAAAAWGVEPTGVDAAVVAGGPAPMGPFALGNLVGLDTLLSISTYLERSYGERFAPGHQLTEMVAAGRLGAKSGGGFEVDPEAPSDGSGARVAERFYACSLAEAAACAREEIAARSDIDLALQLGAGWETGPLAWAKERGLAEPEEVDVS
jgi:3-hydroxyacyl-CoA dehydrogenase